jgi:hypothetical protein
MYAAGTHKGDEQRHRQETLNATFFVRYSETDMISSDDGSLLHFYTVRQASFVPSLRDATNHKHCTG